MSCLLITRSSVSSRGSTWGLPTETASVHTASVGVTASGEDVNHGEKYISLYVNKRWGLTFLATTPEGKLCLEMTHNALVQEFLSVEVTIRVQSADNISEAKFSGEGGDKEKS